MDDRQRPRRLRRGLGRGRGDASLPRPARRGRAASHRPRRHRDAPRGDACRRADGSVAAVEHQWPGAVVAARATSTSSSSRVDRRPTWRWRVGAHVLEKSLFLVHGRETSVVEYRLARRARRASSTCARSWSCAITTRSSTRTARSAPRPTSLERPRAPAPGDRPARAGLAASARALPAVAGLVPELRVRVRARARPRLPRGRDVAGHVRARRSSRAARFILALSTESEEDGRLPPAGARPRARCRRGVGGRERAPRRGRARRRRARRAPATASAACRADGARAAGPRRGPVPGRGPARADGDRRLPVVHRLGPRLDDRAARACCAPPAGSTWRAASSRRSRRSSQGGLLPEPLPRGRARRAEYGTVDAALWFAVAADAYLAQSGDDAFLDAVLAPALEAILDGYAAGHALRHPRRAPTA